MESIKSILEVIEGISETKIKFKDTCRGSHDGQTDMTIYAILNNIVVGYIDYSIFENEIYIEMIEVVEEEKHKGIATKMMHYLRLINSGQKIKPGYSTTEGFNFWESYKEKYMKNKK